jgi:hypothetical protein
MGSQEPPPIPTLEELAAFDPDLAPGVRLLDPLGREIEAGAPPDDHPPGDYPHPCPGDHAHPSCRRPHGRPHHTGDNPPLSRAPSHHLGRRADRGGATCRGRARCRWRTTGSCSWMSCRRLSGTCSQGCANRSRWASHRYISRTSSLSPLWLHGWCRYRPPCRSVSQEREGHGSQVAQQGSARCRYGNWALSGCSC